MTMQHTIQYRVLSTQYSVLKCSILALAVLAGCSSENPDPLPNMQTVGFIRGGAASSTGATAGPAAVVGEGWGTLKGVFVYAGDPPSPKTLPTNNKDPQACGVIPDESLLIDPQTKGIKNIVIFARKVSRVHEDAAAPPGEQVFDQKACIFLSHVLPVRIKAPVDDQELRSRGTQYEPQSAGRRVEQQLHRRRQPVIAYL